MRPATPADERALAVIDHRTWSWAVTPMPLWPVERPFFDAGTRPEDVLVAVVGDRIAGYVKLRPRAGYREEGRLEGQFLLEGRCVDDVLMALAPTGGPDGSAQP